MTTSAPTHEAAASPPATHARYALRGDLDAPGLLTGDDFESRVEAAWHSCRIDRKLMKQLMQRSDAKGWRQFGPWLVLLAASGAGAVFTWGSAWCVPFFVVYGLLYACSDHYAHELSHGTPFRTRWINTALYKLTSFMALHEDQYWRWSHTRHHTHTMLVGRDPEIAVPRPAQMWAAVLDLFFLKSGLREIRTIVQHAFGHINAAGRHFIPLQERPKVVANSRAYVAIFVAVIVACLLTHSWLPAMLVVLPRFYGGPMAQIFNLMQHAGMAEDVHDHRLSTRTVYLNPLFRWMYANMNYHVEHHMFPMVPFHALPQLHEAIRAQCPPAYPSLAACWKEILPTLRRQSSDPDHFVARPLPAQGA
jgi:fatty acid desaturase